MAYDEQLKQGGSGGIKSSASANPSGLKSFNDIPTNSSFATDVNNLFGVKKSTMTSFRDVPNAISIGAEEILTPAIKAIKRRGVIGAPSDFISMKIGDVIDATKQSTDEAAQRYTNLKNSLGTIAFGDSYAPDSIPVQTTPKLTAKPASTTSAIKDPTKPSQEVYTDRLIDSTITQDTKDGKMVIDLGNDRGGTIQFSDRRILSPERIKSLNSQISYNNSQKGLDSFAKNATLTAQREAEGRAVQERIDTKRANELASLWATRMADLDRLNSIESPSIREINQDFITRREIMDLAKRGRTKAAGLLQDRLDLRDNLNEKNYEARLGAQIDREKISSDRNIADAHNRATLASSIYTAQKDNRAADLAESRLNFDVRKNLGESVFKAQQEQNRLLTDYGKDLTERQKSGLGDDIATSLAKYRATFRTNPTYSSLGMILGGDSFKEFSEITNPIEAGGYLADQGFDKDSIESIVRSRFGQ